MIKFIYKLFKITTGFEKEVKEEIATFDTLEDAQTAKYNAFIEAMNTFAPENIIRMSYVPYTIIMDRDFNSIGFTIEEIDEFDSFDDHSENMTAMDAYNKIDNTLCLNSSDLKFGIDEAEHCDCNDIDEMIACLEILKEAAEHQIK